MSAYFISCMHEFYVFWTVSHNPCESFLFCSCLPCPGENRQRYFQLLINGTYTPRTLPVGGEEPRGVSPHAIAEALLVSPEPHTPQKRHSRVSDGSLGDVTAIAVAAIAAVSAVLNSVLLACWKSWKGCKRSRCTVSSFVWSEILQSLNACEITWKMCMWKNFMISKI